LCEVRGSRAGGAPPGEKTGGGSCRPAPWKFWRPEHRPGQRGRASTRPPGCGPKESALDERPAAEQQQRGPATRSPARRRIRGHDAPDGAHPGGECRHGDPAGRPHRRTMSSRCEPRSSSRRDGSTRWHARIATDDDEPDEHRRPRDPRAAPCGDGYKREQGQHRPTRRSEPRILTAASPRRQDRPWQAGEWRCVDATTPAPRADQGRPDHSEER